MKKKWFLALLGLFFFVCCKKELVTKKEVQGRVKRETLSVVSKLPGRIVHMNVSEGDFVQKGDLLAELDIPEVDAKVAQAQGVVKSADAQYAMAEKGATKYQLLQLEAKCAGLKEQYDFVRKSVDRLEVLVRDSLIARQRYDEAMAKLQGAKAQLDAAQAQLKEAKEGIRYEQKMMALGQKDRALAALKEAHVASEERFIIAPRAMRIETITLHLGELVTPGYTVFSGDLLETVWFRFTLPESRLKNLQRGKPVTIRIPYQNTKMKAKISVIKPLTNYADLSTAYPDYEIDESVYEIKVLPSDQKAAEQLLTNATVILEL